MVVASNSCGIIIIILYFSELTHKNINSKSQSLLQSVNQCSSVCASWCSITMGDLRASMIVAHV